MIKVALVGSGNLAFKLYSSLLKIDDVSLVGVYGRNEQTLADFDQALTTTDPLILPKADLTVIAVSDDSIAQVSKQLKPKHGLLVHTSGAQTIKAIAAENRGVCYPLQTFSRDRAIDFSNIPFCIEAEQEANYQLLEQFCGYLSSKVERLSGAERKYLHLAAVYVNNFVNQMYQSAYEILNGQDLSFELLYPLIEETASKVKGVVPAQVQTGPAKRNDQGIINEHLKIQNPRQVKIYKLLTEAIKQSQENEL